MKYFFILLSLVLLSCVSTTDNTSSGVKKHNKGGLYSLMADSEMKRTPDPRLLGFRQKPKWEYTNGIVCSAFLEVFNRTNDSSYFNYVMSYADSMILEDATILTYSKDDYNIDRVNSGKILFELHKLTQESKYRMAIDTLRDQMRYHPRTSEGGFWHKKIYPHQMWLDGLYMGSPFLAQYALEYDEPGLWDDVANQVYLIDKYTWDSEKALYYHGWDESRNQKWADQETGRSPHSWGRGMGWFAMALVDILDFFPEDHPKRADIEKIHKKMARAIVKEQDETGLWWQVLDRPKAEGNYLEGSVSSMFSYFLLKSVNNGYLGEDFANVGKKGYEAIVEILIQENEDGTISLTQVCGVAGLGGNPYRDGSYEYYVNEIIRNDDPKGIGPFIMASLEYEELNQ